jgi:DNA-nicking Smr family endonuclease
MNPVYLLVLIAREIERTTPVSDEPEEEQPVILPIEDSIDLHSFAPRDIPSVVESYLEAAREAGFAEVRLIHGRGKGVQKERVRQILSQSEHVAHFAEATADRGGWGATVVTLKKRS